MGEMVLLMFAFSLLMAFMSVGDSYDGLINVGGKVLCQGCAEGWTRPIQGSRVSITCYGRRQAIYYGSDETRKTGKYELTVSGYIDGKKVNPRSCIVRIENSPDPFCNIATNVNGGSTGVRLDVPITTDPNISKYRLHAFYFSSPYCNKTHTTES
ncbi:hypothetical protein ACET3Z_018473 [Daucus carota]